MAGLGVDGQNLAVIRQLGRVYPPLRGDKAGDTPGGKLGGCVQRAGKVIGKYDQLRHGFLLKNG